VVDQPAVGDPADAVDPDVGHVGGGGAVDDRPARVVDIGQGRRVAAQPDQVGPLARPSDPTSLSGLSAYAPSTMALARMSPAVSARASSPVSFWSIAAASAASNMFWLALEAASSVPTSTGIPTWRGAGSAPARCRKPDHAGHDHPALDRAAISS
jgi:hypothetical protein